MRLFAFFIMMSGALSNASAQDLIPYNKNEKFGLCDIYGKIKLEPQYNDVSFFKPKLNGYSIEKDGKFGFMNKGLQMVIPPVADQPVFDSGEHLIVKKGNELIYYDKNYKETQRRQLKTSASESGLVYPADYPQQQSEYDREEVLKMFKEKFGKKYKNVDLNVVSANNTYFHIESFSEGKRKNEGLFLPKTKTFLLNDEQMNYQSAVWVPSKQCYYIKIKQGNDKGVITHDRKTVFEPKQYSSLVVMPNYIAYTEPGTTTATIAFYYVISSGKSIKNEFSSFRYFATVSDQGKEFEVFSAVVDNPDLHKSAQVFIGENGTKYYDLDFAK